MGSRRWWLLGLLLLPALLYAFGAGEWLRLETLHAHLDGLRERYAEQPLVFSLGFGFLYVVVTGLSLPGAGVLSLIAGALFGVGVGLLVVGLAAATGATLAMLAARYLLREPVRARYGLLFQRFDAGLERDGAWYLLMLRLTPVVPFFAINLAMGLTRMPALQFWWVSLLGMLPVMAVFLQIGTSLGEVDSVAGVVSPGLLLGLSLLALIPVACRAGLRALQLRRRYARWRRPLRFDYDLAVIGAGSGGLVAARLAAATQARVVLIEQDAMGGECLNRGCVPSKTLLRASRVAHEARKAGRFGVEAGEVRVDFTAVMARVAETIRAIAPQDSVERYAGLGVQCLAGQARLLSPWEIETTTAEGRLRCTAARIVIACGSRPKIPDLPGLDAVPHATTETIWSISALPSRLVVLGGGPAGCELAQAFARLGAQVVIVQRPGRLLPHEDEAASRLLARRFREEGIAVLAGATALACEKSSQGPALRVQFAGEEVLVAFDLLLLATGRESVAPALGLDALDIALQPDGTPRLDATGATSLPNVFVVGDASGLAGTTPAAARQASRSVFTALLGAFAGARATPDEPPRLIFTSPQVAQVGLTAGQAAARGLRVETTTLALEALDRSVIDGHRDGFVSVLTEAGGPRLLGATIVAEDTEPLVAVLALALRQRRGLATLLTLSLPYPTHAEAARVLAAGWREGRTRPWQRRALKAMHAWRRGDGWRAAVAALKSATPGE